jgi:light-regulated signal transduction histidine kinase (bacteriophytochrome)
MGYNSVYCENLKQKRKTNYKSEQMSKRTDLINELVDPICVISNANEILSKRLSKFVDDETRAYFEMISRAATKTKAIIDELRNEKIFVAYAEKPTS